jgi:UDP-N-acetylmuramyl tripeptide synthase
MSLLTLLLAYFAKIIAFLSRLFSKGSGTSLPGLVVEKYFVKILQNLAKEYSEITFISGTNGKTTTRAMLVYIYEKQGRKVCTNRGGANIIRGIASSLLLDLDFFGRAKSEYLILEVEEASLPILTKYIKPQNIILTNLFRDQLDVYGEIDQTMKYFLESLKNLGIKNKVKTKKAANSLALNNKIFTKFKNSKRPQGLKVYINYDDKKLLTLIDKLNFYSIGFSLEMDDQDKPKYEKSESVVSFPDELYLASNILSKNLRTSFSIKVDKNKEFLVETRLPGSFNVYNSLPAFLIGYEKFGADIIPSMKEFSPVFGRGERVLLENSKELIMFLVKNPAGFDEVLKLIKHDFEDQEINLCIAINDKIADGKDVSWLWDISLEDFVENQKIKGLITSGSRGLDMLLRLQYSGLDVSLNQYEPSYESLYHKFEKMNQNIILLATYTAILDIREELAKNLDIPGISSAGF